MKARKHWTSVAVFLVPLIFFGCSDDVDSTMVGVWCRELSESDCRLTMRILEDGRMFRAIDEKTCKPSKSKAYAFGRSLVPKEATFECEHPEDGLVECEMVDKNLRWTILCWFNECSMIANYRLDNRSDRLIFTYADGASASFDRAGPEGCWP